MTMLSRVADRLFWAARYLERAEDTARLTNAYTHMMMDVPEETAPGWDILIKILAAEPAFEARSRAYSEQNVLKFLIADLENPGGIYHAIKAARENVRTTRDVLPQEAWELVNELYLYTQESAERSIGRRNRYQFLEEIIGRCQEINGLLVSTLCRDHTYRFIQIGRLLERADMTTRIIDVGAAALLGEERQNSLHRGTVDPLIWACLLRSLSAVGAYRREFGPSVEANHMVDFVMRDPTLPRSVRYCLNDIRAELLPLKNHKPALKLLDQARRSLSRFNPHTSSLEQLHRFIDQFQQKIFTLSAAIDEQWLFQNNDEKPSGSN